MREIEAEKREIDGETIEMELLSTLTGTFVPDEEEYEDLEYEDFEYDDEGELQKGDDLVQCEDAIRERVEKENQMENEGEAPCNLMEYFYGSDAVKRKVISAAVSVKNVNDVLYGCITLKLREPLDESELSELQEYITGQYSDGWGEGFEQREIPVDGGKLYVHFWQYDGFRFLSEDEAGEPAEMSNRAEKPGSYDQVPGYQRICGNSSEFRFRQFRQKEQKETRDRRSENCR